MACEERGITFASIHTASRNLHTTIEHLAHGRRTFFYINCTTCVVAIPYQVIVGHAHTESVLEGVD